MADKLGFTETELLASICKQSFFDFVKEFWSVTSAEKPVWNWHVEYLCSELQIVAERIFKGLPREYDLITNVSPGTTKSTVFSVMFPAWAWTRMPSFKVIGASYAYSLAMDLSRKCRDVVRSDKYQRCFPYIKMRDEQDAKGFFVNTANGSRYAVGVNGSVTGMHAHAIVCLPWHANILTSRGWMPIGQVVEDRVSVDVAGFDHSSNQVVWRAIDAYETGAGREMWRVVTSDGRKLELTADHRVFVVGRGYVAADSLLIGDRVIYAEEGKKLTEVPDSLFGVWGQDGERAAIGEEILRQGMQKEGAERRSAPPFLWEGQLPKVREDVGSGRRQILRQGLFDGVQQRRKSSALRKSGGNEMRILSRADICLSKKSRQREILFPRLRQQTPRRKDVGQRESELHPRGRLRALLGRVHNATSGGAIQGRQVLSALRQEREAERREYEHTPSGLEQGQQHAAKSALSVSVVPYGTAGLADEAPTHGETVVVAVEREVWIPDKVYNVQVAGTHNYFANGVLVHNCDDPLDPEQSFSEAEIKIANRWMTYTLPSRKVDRSIAPLILVQQRLNHSDPTGDMLENAKRPGAFPVKHIKLPADDSFDVQPEELKSKYVDGLMDPVRLPWSVLRAERARNEYGYCSQYGQDPRPAGSRMFEEHYFNKRVKAAPYNCQRIRYWDRAASPESAGSRACYTAGVLIGRSPEGLYFIEHVVHGQWEPDERNKRMLACAHRDRNKYGKYEPVIWVEREGGSSGRDAWKGVARALAGFNVREDAVSGKKEVRAEPWSAQLAAGTVSIVDDGTWNVRGYVEEHCLFPHGRLNDMVDASTGSFNLLSNAKKLQPMRVYSVKTKPKQEVKIVVSSFEAFPDYRDDVPLLVISVRDEASPEIDLDLSHLENVIDYASFTFPDFDPELHQDKWEEPVERYGKLPKELVIPKDHAKKLWAFLLRPRDPYPSRVLFVGGALAVGAARGVLEGLRLSEGSLLIHPPDSIDGVGANRHLQSVLRTSRNLVYG